MPWDDPSGRTLRDWLGLTEEQFYDPSIVAIVPMGFCYPGSASSGDKPPRSECAPLWHEELLGHLAEDRLEIIIGTYAQRRYISDRAPTLTETVGDWAKHLPRQVVLPTPRPEPALADEEPVVRAGHPARRPAPDRPGHGRAAVLLTPTERPAQQDRFKRRADRAGPPGDDRVDRTDSSNYQRDSSESANVQYREDDRLGIITLDRPEKRNAFTDEMVDGVAAAVDRATASADVAVIILRGAGGPSHLAMTSAPSRSSPGRLNLRRGQRRTMRRGPKPRQGNWDPVRDYQFMNANVRRFMALWECPKPVIAEISGWAIGGTTDLILCADLLYMADDAHIGYAPSRVYGLPTTMMWIHRLGLEHAKRYLLTGRAIDARTAQRIGLVSEIVPGRRAVGRGRGRGQAEWPHHPGQPTGAQQAPHQPGYENMGLRTTQMLGTFFDGMAATARRPCAGPRT